MRWQCAASTSFWPRCRRARPQPPMMPGNGWSPRALVIWNSQPRIRRFFGWFSARRCGRTPALICVPGPRAPMTISRRWWHHCRAHPALMIPPCVPRYWAIGRRPMVLPNFCFLGISAAMRVRGSTIKRERPCFARLFRAGAQVRQRADALALRRIRCRPSRQASRPRPFTKPIARSGRWQSDVLYRPRLSRDDGYMRVTDR